MDPLLFLNLLGAEDLDPEEVSRFPKDAPATEEEPSPSACVEGRFRIDGQLGQGGFADVYRATDLLLKREVALKFLRRSEDKAKTRFAREAQAAAAVRHPNVLTIYSFGELAGRIYLAFELVPEARTLDEAFAELDLEARLDLFEQVLGGVAAAHAQGVVHRDLKPENVLVRPTGEALVADFGLARLETSDLTKTGEILGTPAYMAPEQIRGQKISPATDVWSLGLILYEALFEERWVKGGENLAAVAAQILSAKFEPERSAPRSLEELLFRRVLLVEPAARLADAGAFLEALRAARTPRQPASGRGPFWALAGAGLGASLTWLALTLSDSAEARPTPPPTSANPAPPSSPSPTPPPVASPPSPATPAASPAPPTEPNVHARRRAMVGWPTAQLERAAEAGDPLGQFLLGLRFRQGFRAERNPERAGQLWGQAAEQGHPEAMEALSVYLDSQGKREAAKAWREKAVLAGATQLLVHNNSANRREKFSFAARVNLGHQLSEALAAGNDLVPYLIARKHFLAGNWRAFNDQFATARALDSPEIGGIQAWLLLAQREPDYAAADRLLERAYAAGSPIAAATLAKVSALGLGREADLEAAQGYLADARALHLEPGWLRYLEFLLSLEQSGARAIDLQELERACGNSPAVLGQLALTLLDEAQRQPPRIQAQADLHQAGFDLLWKARGSFDPRVHWRYAAEIVRTLPAPDQIGKAEVKKLGDALRSAGALGDEDSLVKLGLLTLKAGNSKGGLEILRELHHRGNRAASAGLLNYETQLSQPNWERVEALMEDLVAAGELGALNRAAKNLGKRRSFQQALRPAERSARAGDPEGALIYAQLLLKRDPPDLERLREALKHLEQLPGETLTRAHPPVALEVALRLEDQAAAKRWRERALGSGQ